MSDQIRAEVEDSLSEHAKLGELSFKVTVLNGDTVLTTRDWVCGTGMTVKGRDYCVDHVSKRSVEIYLEGVL